MTQSEIISRTGIPLIESMLLHRQLRWSGHVIRMSNCVLFDQLKLGHRSVGGQKKRFKDHIKSILKKCNIALSRLETLAPNRATGDLPVPLECHTLTMNTIELQLSDADISMLQCSAQFRILFINAHFMADNASHALASSTTVRPTLNVDEEVVVIRNGWTPKKQRR